MFGNEDRGYQTKAKDGNENHPNDVQQDIPGQNCYSVLRE